MSETTSEQTATTQTSSADGESKESMVDQARRKAAGAKDQAQRGAEDLTSEAGTALHAKADSAKGSAADELSMVAEALDNASGDLRSGSASARTFSQIADGLRSTSESMRSKDVDELASQLNQFAVNKPAVFLGGAALLGFAASRFAQASSSGAESSGGQTLSSNGASKNASTYHQAPGVSDRVDPHSGANSGEKIEGAIA